LIALLLKWLLIIVKVGEIMESIMKNKLRKLFYSLLFVSFFASLSSGVLADVGSQGEGEKRVGNVLFFFNPAKATIVTDYQPEKLINLINDYRDLALSGALLELGINTGYLEMDVKGSKAKVTFFSSAFGGIEKAVRLKIAPTEDGSGLEVKVKMYCNHIKELFEKSQSEGTEVGRWRFSNAIEDDLLQSFSL